MKIGQYLFIKYMVFLFVVTVSPFLFTNYISGDWDAVKGIHLIWGAIISTAFAGFLILYHYYRLRRIGQPGFSHENIKLNQVRTIESSSSIEDVYKKFKASTAPEFFKVKFIKGRIQLGFSLWTYRFYHFFIEEGEKGQLTIRFNPILPFTLMDFGEAFYRVEQVVRLVKQK